MEKNKRKKIINIKEKPDSIDHIERIGNHAYGCLLPHNYKVSMFFKVPVFFWFYKK